MTNETLKRIPKQTLIKLCKELINKLQTHNYNSPDVFALYGYTTLLLEYANKLKLHTHGLAHHYYKELEIAVSSIGADREKEFKFLFLLKTESTELLDELENL